MSNKIKWQEKENDTIFFGTIGEKSTDKYYGVVWTSKEGMGMTNNSDLKEGNFGGGIDYINEELPTEIYNELKEKQKELL